MNRSESIKEFAAAMSMFQGMASQPKKTSKVEQSYQDKNGKWQKKEYNYSTLDCLIETIKEPLAKCGLSYTQNVKTSDSVEISTLLMHKSGEWMEGDPVSFKIPDNKPQTLGSLITYGRRYGLSAALGLASEEDDDGGRAQDAAQKAKQDDPRKNTKPDEPTKEELEEIDEVNNRAINEIELEALREKEAAKGIASVAGRFKKASDEELKFKEFKEAMNALEALPDKKKVDLGL